MINILFVTKKKKKRILSRQTIDCDSHAYGIPRNFIFFFKPRIIIPGKENKIFYYKIFKMWIELFYLFINFILLSSAVILNRIQIRDWKSKIYRRPNYIQSKSIQTGFDKICFYRFQYFEFSFADPRFEIKEKMKPENMMCQL